MDLDTASNATQLVGAVNGVYIAGALIGSLLSSQTSDSLGRKKSVFLSAALAALDGALQAGSVHIGMFIVARLVAGLGIGKQLVFNDRAKQSLTCTGSLFAAIPLYQSEVSPPKSRGLIVGLHGIFISFGTILCK